VFWESGVTGLVAGGVVVLVPGSVVAVCVGSVVAAAVPLVVGVGSVDEAAPLLLDVPVAAGAPADVLPAAPTILSGSWISLKNKLATGTVTAVFDTALFLVLAVLFIVAAVEVNSFCGSIACCLVKVLSLSGDVG